MPTAHDADAGVGLDGFERLGDTLKLHPEFARLVSLAAGEAIGEPSSCERCRDGGFLRRDVPATDPDFGKLVPCECRRQEILAKRIARFWSRSQAPTEYAECTLESYPGDETAVPTLREWLDSDRWLVLSGGYGVGKTGLAVALLRIFAERGVSVLFVNAPAMLRRVRATYGKHDGEDERAVIDSLAEVEILAIDDIGKERLTEWGQELLYDVTNRRYSEGLRTIVTTNLAMHELEAHLGGATFWRIYEKSQFIGVEGNLRRRRKGA